MNFQRSIDKVVEIISPSMALNRAKSRIRIEGMSAAKRAFDAARRSRFKKDVNMSNASANMDVNQALAFLRTRSRNLVNNNEYATNIARIIPNNVVGTGIIPSIDVDGSKLQSKKVKTAWKKWADKLDCDVEGGLTFNGIQHLVMRTVVVSGECLVVRRRMGSDHKLPIKLLVLEGDFIDTSHYEPVEKDGSCTLYGIAFNADGSRKGYWLYDKNPCEFMATSSFYKAEDVIHIYERERPGQYRGLPFSKSSMIRMDDLDDYEFAERVRAKVAASFTAFITGTEDASAISPEDFETMEPNSIVRLKSSENVHFSSPPLTHGFEAFTRQSARAISAGNGVTYESMTNDYSNVNFSSGRMGWIELSRNVQQWQWNMMIPHLCDRVFDWFVEAIQLKGVIPFGKDVTAIWTAPRREMIDPYKENKAREIAMQNGFTSRMEILREDGYTPEEINAEILEDKKFQDKNGLNFFQNKAADVNDSLATQSDYEPKNKPQKGELDEEDEAE